MKTIGQIAYEAYLDFSGGVSLISGHPLPEWDAQEAKLQLAWEASAHAVAEAVEARSNEPLPPAD
jgi:hypothetical protein